MNQLSLVATDCVKKSKQTRREKFLERFIEGKGKIKGAWLELIRPR